MARLDGAGAVDVIASHRASRDARPLGRAMATRSRGTQGSLRCLDCFVAPLLAMTVPPECAMLYRDGNDSEMAPQAPEIAQNGLGDPPARGSLEGESIRRIPYQSSGKTCSASARRRAAASPTRTPAITRS